MEKKITILGQEVTVTFNMATMIAYESITDEPFSLDKLEFRKTQYALYCAAITSSKSNKNLPEDFIKNLANEVRPADMKALDDAISECLADFYRIPKPANDPALDGKTDDEAAGNGEEEKN